MSQPNEFVNSSPESSSLEAALDEQRDLGGDFTCRSGIAQIDSNDDNGLYTITEQRRDPESSQWQDASSQLGYVNASARDFRDCDSGQVNQLVRFWEQRAIGGQLELLIDAADPLLLKYGKVTANWASGSTITINPSKRDGSDPDTGTTITLDDWLTGDTGADSEDPWIQPDVSQGDVLAYLPYLDDPTKGLALGVKWVHAGPWVDDPDYTEDVILDTQHKSGTGVITQTTYRTKDDSKGHRISFTVT